MRSNPLASSFATRIPALPVRACESWTSIVAAERSRSGSGRRRNVGILSKARRSLVVRLAATEDGANYEINFGFREG